MLTMGKLEINTDYIAAIVCYTARKIKECEYLPIYTKKKTLKERIFGESFMRKKNRKEGMIFMNDVNECFTETELKEQFPQIDIDGFDIYVKPKVEIELSIRKTVTIYFKTYEEVLEFTEWLEKQNGYINLQIFKESENHLIYFN